MISLKHSFKLLSKKELANLSNKKGGDSTARIEEKEIIKESSDGKRAFLKVAGIAGAGLVASQLLPKSAEALIMGNAPTASNMGIKNASGTRINPATEDTLAGIKAQSDQLTFDTGNLNVKVAGGGFNLKNTIGTSINPATEDTLALIQAKTNLLQFDGSNNLLTSVGGTGSIVGLKDSNGNTINPATEDSLFYLRKMVKLMESQATVDAQNRQRVTVDSFGGVVTGTGASGTGVPRVTVSSDSTFNANIGTLNGWNQQMFQDVARNTYSNGIRLYVQFN